MNRKRQEKKAAERRLTVKERREKNREARREERALLKQMMADKGYEDAATIRDLDEKAPMPPRNGPCPLHPEFKLKKCPHGCLEVFQNHRSRVAGDTRVVSVEPDAQVLEKDPVSGVTYRQKLVGSVGREDLVAATVRELTQATKDE